MRGLILVCVTCAVAAVAGCSGESKVTNVGPPVDTGNGKGLPAMKPPSEPGGSTGKVPKPKGVR